MADYYISQGGSRILNATRVDQSGADNANVADWVKTNDFIIAININSNGKDTVAAQYKLRWRNKTDSGTFADVGAATEINYNADTDHVNGDPIPEGGRKCDSQGGDTWQAGAQVEGASLSNSIDLADEYETEVHFALDCSGATDEKEYEFELYDSTLGVTRGTCGATITMAAGAAEGWLSGWSYRKEITITGQSGAGTNYQVDLDIGDSAGGDFHLEGHCTNFPQDIEVTDNDGTTLLKFWIADITADPLEMTVKVADDLGSNQTIYVYYGKSGATTNSNGANTFIQYHGAASATFVDSYNVTPTNIAFEVYGKVTSATHTIRWGLKNTAGLDDTDDVVMISSYNVDNNHYFVTKNEGTQSYVNEIPSATVDVLQRMKILMTGSTWHAYVDGDEVSTGISTNFPNEDMGLTMYLTAGTAEQDWSFVRKYIATEPAFSSAGIEETPSAGVSPTSIFYGPLVGPLGGPT